MKDSERKLSAAERALLDEVAGPRQLEGWRKWLLLTTALGWSLFQLALASVLVLNSTYIRSIHLAFGLFMIYLSYPLLRKPRVSGIGKLLSDRSKFRSFELVLAIIAALVALYIALDYTGISSRIGQVIPRDRWVGIALFVLLLEGARRVVGPALPIIAIVLTGLAFTGPHLPGWMAFRGIGLDRFLSQITLTNEGIFGVPLGVSANIVFLFVLFGAMLERAGGGRWFIDLSSSLLGGFTGGPAKACVVASGMVGMVSGSSVANAVTAGTFTIPLMKNIGYPSHKAGAVETAASVGGQLMPPIMGAAAFIMAEYLNVPYLAVVKAAIVPAVLAYSALFFVVHLEAAKLGLRGIPRSELPRFFPTLVSGLQYLIPIGVLIYKLVVLRHTPESSAFLAIVFLSALMIVQPLIRARLAGKPIITELKSALGVWLESLSRGALNMTTVAVATASAGIVIGVMTMGPGGMINEAVDQLAGGNIMLLLVVSMFACLLLGMGLPTTANYIVMASLTAPIIVIVGTKAGLEVPLIAAHMFVFYFGIQADITPPVALAAFAASGIAKSDPLKTGVQAFYYALPTFLIPYMFIFNHDLLLVNVHHWYDIVAVFITGLIAATSIASVLQGWLTVRNRWYEAILLALAALMLFRPNFTAGLLGLPSKWYIYSVGIAIWGGVLMIQQARRYKNINKNQ